jgi:uncharacterized protein YbaA (DUF1428 family)
MEYIDGYVVAVPAANKEAYLEAARKMADVFKDHGATRCVESWGDDVPDGEHTSFLKSVQAREDEVVVFSWVTWPSKEARTAGMEKAYVDERLKEDNDLMPFDGSRMIFGGFQIILDE